MDIDFYAVGWQSRRNGGVPKDFRIINFKKGKKNYIENLKFAGIKSNETNIIDKFNSVKDELQDVSTNGNNTEVPFYRKIDDSILEFNKIEIINKQTSQEQEALVDFKNIRFYILQTNDDDINYRFYIKAIRTANIKSGYVLYHMNHEYQITDLSTDGKELPCIISYVEEIDKDNNIIQYVFDVSNYEEIFGLNETKIHDALNNLDKFVRGNKNDRIFTIANGYTVSITDDNFSKIEEKIKSTRRFANTLSKYKGQAKDYKIEDIKRANEISNQFFNKSFDIDDTNKEIIVTNESFETWISVIANLTKLGIAAHKFENKLAGNKLRRN